MVPIFGGRYWTVLSNRLFGGALHLAGNCYSKYRYSILGIYHNCPAVRFCWCQLASSMGNISFFFQSQQGSALGVNGGPATRRQRDADDCSGGDLPADIRVPGVFTEFLKDGSILALSNAAIIWGTAAGHRHHCCLGGHERHRQLKGFGSRSAPGPEAPAYVAVKPVISGDVWFFYRLFCRLCNAGENAVSGRQYSLSWPSSTLYRRAGAFIRRHYLRPSRRRPGHPDQLYPDGAIYRPAVPHLAWLPAPAAPPFTWCLWGCF